MRLGPFPGFSTLISLSFVSGLFFLASVLQDPPVEAFYPLQQGMRPSQQAATDSIIAGFSILGALTPQVDTTAASMFNRSKCFKYFNCSAVSTPKHTKIVKVFALGNF